MALDFNRPITTRSGCEVRLFTQNAQVSGLPLVGEYKGVSGNWYLMSWNAQGEVFKGSCLNLINPPQTVKLDGWMNVYQDGTFSELHHTRADADRIAGPGRIACKHIECVVTEGDGL